MLSDESVRPELLYSKGGGVRAVESQREELMGDIGAEEEEMNEARQPVAVKKPAQTNNEHETIF